MKSYRTKYIKVAKGNKTICGITCKTDPIWCDCTDTNPVFVVKNGGKKKAK